MNTFSFLGFNGFPALFLAGFTALFVAGFVASFLFGRRDGESWATKLGSETLKVVASFVCMLALIIGFLAAFLGGLDAAATALYEQDDRTGVTEQPLVHIPGTETLVNTDGAQMFVAVQEGDEVALVAVGSITYADGDPVLRTETTCEPRTAMSVWGKDGYSCTSVSRIAILPR